MQGLGFHDVCHLKLLDEPGLPNPLHIRSGIIIVTIFVIFIIHTIFIIPVIQVLFVISSAKIFLIFIAIHTQSPIIIILSLDMVYFIFYLSSKQNFIFCQTRLNFRTTHGNLACLLFRGATLSASLVIFNYEQ